MRLDLMRKKEIGVGNYDRIFPLMGRLIPSEKPHVVYDDIPIVSVNKRETQAAGHTA